MLPPERLPTDISRTFLRIIPMGFTIRLVTPTMISEPTTKVTRMMPTMTNVIVLEERKNLLAFIPANIVQPFVPSISCAP